MTFDRVQLAEEIEIIKLVLNRLRRCERALVEEKKV